MISRKPNNRASTEKAPGPRIITATDSVARSDTEEIEANRFGTGAEITEAWIAAAPKATIAAATGVSKPIRSRLPVAVASKPATHGTPARPESAARTLAP